MADVDDIDKTYEERTSASKNKKEYSDRKKLVERAYHRSVKPDSRDTIGEPVEVVTEMLALSDRAKKEWDLREAYQDLTYADAALHSAKNMDKKSKHKLAQAIVSRAARLFYQAKNDEAVSNKTYGLIKELEKDYHVRPRKPGKSLESGVLAILSLGLGLFFLSPNITGNVIGNASFKVSNLVGSLMFGVGLVGIWSFVKSR